MYARKMCLEWPTTSTQNACVVTRSHVQADAQVALLQVVTDPLLSSHVSLFIAVLCPAHLQFWKSTISSDLISDRFFDLLILLVLPKAGINWRHFRRISRRPSSTRRGRSDFIHSWDEKTSFGNAAAAAAASEGGGSEGHPMKIVSSVRENCNGWGCPSHACVLFH